MKGRPHYYLTDLNNYTREFLIEIVEYQSSIIKKYLAGVEE